MTTPRPNRRDLLRCALATSAGVALLDRAASADAPATRPARALRLAHLTDVHVQPEHGAADGLRACLRHVREHAKPDLVVFGGDQVMDVFEHDADRATLLFDLFSRIVAEECAGLPVRYVLGNHDIFGWNREKAKTTGDEPDYGKAWPLKAYAMPGRFYSFEQAGWKFVVLDSVQDDGGGSYVAALDDEQFAWLEAELRQSDPNTPVVLFSHVPILAVCPLFFGKSDTDKGLYPKPRWNVSRALLHLDARKLKDLFHRHANVRLAVSGHIHLTDRVDYLGVTYLCDPAVSGSWWHGPMQEFANAYTTIDLFPDGTFAHEHVPFGWTAR